MIRNFQIEATVSVGETSFSLVFVAYSESHYPPATRMGSEEKNGCWLEEGRMLAKTQSTLTKASI